ncbi:hypothetical protein B14911_06181 [Bacillus sp. NRRL B-14911]|nr:hypothetical protein B14911_06181 [Bacillus sp. NRRL B-14911]
MAFFFFAKTALLLLYGGRSGGNGRRGQYMPPFNSIVQLSGCQASMGVND